MSARQRESVERQPSSESQFNLAEFLRRFPTNDHCLDYLKDRFYPDGSECPKCGKRTKFHRVSGRSAYACQYCRIQVYPTSGTIVHKSTTSLQLWFWAIFLMSSTRCGISAKQLEREIGVTYKTAWRMFNVIRDMLGQDTDPPLSGAVEVDETYVGGKAREWPKRTRAEHAARKVPVFGAVERGGRVVARVMTDALAPSIKANMRQYVLPASVVYTDDANVYRMDLDIRREYPNHHRIQHHTRIYVDGEVHTQTIDGFFGLIKNALRGVHHGVSRRHLQGYLNEYTFRWNNRDDPTPLFWAILAQVRKDRLAAG
jgi:transposase-like protein